MYFKHCMILSFKMVKFFSQDVVIYLIRRFQVNTLCKLQTGSVFALTNLYGQRINTDQSLNLAIFNLFDWARAGPSITPYDWSWVSWRCSQINFTIHGKFSKLGHRVGRTDSLVYSHSNVLDSVWIYSFSVFVDVNWCFLSGRCFLKSLKSVALKWIGSNFPHRSNRDCTPVYTVW